ncbi:MAG: phosphoethanolamine--lipid A transferase [Lautropia sp.]|nr:phosphoethanolamine--lipid A transferase [Lautropia sp.]
MKVSVRSSSGAHRFMPDEAGEKKTRLLRWRPLISTELLIFLVSLFFALFSNTLFWQSALVDQAQPWKTGASLLMALLGAHCLLMGLIVWRWNAKLLIMVLLIVSALAADYMTRFHVYLDTSIIRSVLTTEPKESAELITPALIMPLLLFAVLPMLLVWRVRLKQRTLGKGLLCRGGFLLFSLVLGVGGVLLSFQELSALMRNHKELRYLATPGNYLVGLSRIAWAEQSTKAQARILVGTDARLAERPAGSKPRLLVIVAGEAARAQNWGLNGYERQTTPGLAARQDIINFPDMHSCGTNTEVSLPCMFSPFGRREGYDERKIREHTALLHVLAQAGISSLWRDNQTGCKGVCEGLPTQRLDSADDPRWCRDGRCYDEILLQNLEAEVRAVPGDRVIVLHQLGNHGPSYHDRYPETMRRFTPTCDQSDLGKCSREEIVNAYDNALLYTDHLLSRTIDILSNMTDYETAMIYASDHGESLGEKGLYLHGIPYAIAPKEQTSIPMVMWFSPSFASSRGLDLSCVRERAAAYTDHDNLFASVLGLLQVQTSVYDRELDLFANCAPAVQASP